MTSSPPAAVDDYLAKVAAAPLSAVAPYLRTTCPECGDSSVLPEDPDHAMIGRHVIIGCEGYHLVDPNVVGIEAPNWCDWRPADVRARVEDIIEGYMDGWSWRPRWATIIYATALADGILDPEEDRPEVIAPLLRARYGHPYQPRALDPSDWAEGRTILHDLAAGNVESCDHASVKYGTRTGAWVLTDDQLEGVALKDVAEAFSGDVLDAARTVVRLTRR